MYTEETPEKEVIGYYEALELMFQNIRANNEFRTHFGLFDQVPEDYCFVKNCLLAHTNEFQTTTKEMVNAQINLEERIFGHLDTNKSFSILDVGFGTGGTLASLANKSPRFNMQGVNLNSVQFIIAESHLNKYPNVKINLEDILEYKSENRVDIIYFIESAFHIAPKEDLCLKISELLNENGEIYIIDVFCSDRLFQKIKNRETSLFTYQSIQQWEELLKPYNLKMTGFENVSSDIADFCNVKTSEEEFINEILPSVIPGNIDQYLPHIKLIRSGYKKLSQQLASGLLQYGILKFKREQS